MALSSDLCNLTEKLSFTTTPALADATRPAVQFSDTISVLSYPDHTDHNPRKKKSVKKHKPLPMPGLGSVPQRGTATGPAGRTLSRQHSYHENYPYLRTQADSSSSTSCSPPT